jgi:hypothetical protein
MVLRWRWVVVAGLALVLVACGGGGTGVRELEPAPDEGPMTDTAIARTIVLEEADMPRGWRGAAHTEDPNERARARQLSACLGRPDPETTRTAIVHGPDLSMERSQVSSIATVLNTAEDARAGLAAVRGPKYDECVMAAFTEDLERQVPEATVQDALTEPLPVQTFGDASVGIRLTASLVYPDHTDKLFADLVYITKDRATVSITFFSFNQPFSPALQQSLISRVGHRIATA